ncbi:histidinol-phosphate transaminase [Ruicaihuangia caeni]|uniref:Aromatic amino acid aminotransferase n=1 Tax=Ruicaihuangia caeni TaxID=3042517 RepID=A0AAW6TCH3_9MICO|nr:histidinol-phosphate transaminase [Klugiella sp. YN-L-19]MDI2099075.1 histidinol-phosphate transaminase [Klugiella sp. YN-L-19]
MTRVRLRAEIESLPPYRQGKPADAASFKLSSNENPFDPLPSVRDSIDLDSFNRYPDALASTLRSRLADRYGVTPDEVHIGSGSVAIIAQLLAAAVQHGDEVVYSWRSFEAYPLLAVVAGAVSVRVPNLPDHRHDLDAMAAAITERTRLVFVCSPNNPTGSIVTQAEFDDFMAKVPPTVLVALDEAYIEFCRDPDVVDGIASLRRYPNLVVLRTFSKAYGLAGLRVGYAVGPDYVLDAVRSTAIPLSVTLQAEQAAIASLDHEGELLERVDRIARLRDDLWRALVDLGWDVPQPHGNFVWLPTGDRTEEIAALLDRHGLITRPFHPDGIRVSIGEPASVDRLLTALGEVA